MLDIQPVRTLTVDPATHPQGRAFLSAASGLVRLDRWWYVLADDEHHLGVFDGSSTRPGQCVRLFEGELPDGRKKRKAAKPDLEALSALPPDDAWPHGALLALGSGSRPNRYTGALLVRRESGQADVSVRLLDLTPLYAPIATRFGKLNIEGALSTKDELVLLQRGNKGERISASIHFEWQSLRRWLLGESAIVPAPRVRVHDLGDIEGVPFGFTDGASLGDGCWAFAAVAEDTDDSYLDGACLGAEVGVVDAHGKVLALERLASACKVEGIAAERSDSGWTLTMVTDADDPEVPAQMVTTVLPVRRGT